MKNRALRPSPWDYEQTRKLNEEQKLKLEIAREALSVIEKAQDLIWIHDFAKHTLLKIQ